MLERLYELIPEIIEKSRETNEWDSLIINRRKPHTYRIFRMFGPWCVCLHRFHTCDEHEAFAHPHPWPAAFFVLDGKYKMQIGRSQTHFMSPDNVATFIMNKWSAYEIVEPLTWHSVIPLQTTYTIMVNGPEWVTKHRDTRTTKGKDLECMSVDEVGRELTRFRRLLTNYQRYSPDEDSRLATSGLQKPDEGS